MAGAGDPPSLVPVLSVAAASRCGARRDENEDAYLTLTERGLFCVADGMGGHADGQLASLSVARILERMVGAGSLEERVETVERSLHRINTALRSEAAKSGLTSIIGATVVALVLDADYAVCVWAGDSRCYLVREEQLFQMTRDHGGAQAPDQRRTNVVTRAIGSGETLELDRVVVEVEAGDSFLLCSDGVSDYLSADDILACLTGPGAHATDDLVDAAVAAGSRDDVTAVLVRVDAAV